MLFFLTVDLASKFSAAVLRDETGQVRWQGDSTNKTAKQWVLALANVSHGIMAKGHELHILVEDVPYGISNQAMTKPVTRLQGMLILALDRDFYFINPSTWQKEYDGVARSPKDMTKTEGAKYRIEAARQAAERLGYEAPDLVGQWQAENPKLKPLKKYTNPLDKNRTDYVDAFLINDWLQRHLNDYTTITGVQLAMI